MNWMPWKSAIALAELVALLDVGDGGVERALRDAERLRADGQPGVIEGAQRGLEAGARLADDPVGRDRAVLEVDLAGRAALDAELALLRPDREARVVLVHDERGDAVGPLVRVGHRHDRVVRRDAGVGDPALRPVEHPAVAVEHGAGAHRRRVRAGLALGQRVADHRLAGGDRRHVLLQLLRAGQDDRLRAELVHRRDERGRRARAGDLLDHDAGRDRVGAGPPYSSGMCTAWKPARTSAS